MPLRSYSENRNKKFQIQGGRMSRGPHPCIRPWFQWNTMNIFLQILNISCFNAQFPYMYINYTIHKYTSERDSKKDPPFKDGNVRFTMIPLKSDQKSWRYCCISESKNIFFLWASPLLLINKNCASHSRSIASFKRRVTWISSYNPFEFNLPLWFNL